MRVRDVILLLKAAERENPNAKIVMASDAEGNRVSAIDEVTWQDKDTVCLWPGPSNEGEDT